MAAAGGGGGPTRVHRVVLTGGPCAGKTSAQSRLADVFENLGWKVYRVPETASIIIPGGVQWPELTPEQSFKFQEDLLKAMMQIESTFFHLADGHTNKNVLVICDRGTMDASAFLEVPEWQRMMKLNGWDPVSLRDERYHHIVHMMSAARGAEAYYSLDNNVARKEGLDLAKEMDLRAQKAWLGHPYYDLVDNSTDFDTKLRKVIELVCQHAGVSLQDRFAVGARKRKFLVKIADPDNIPIKCEDFEVQSNYLLSRDDAQARIRQRGQDGVYTYTHTVRIVDENGKTSEKRTPLAVREYQALLLQQDPDHCPVYKLRRCFLWNEHYFQLDMYKEPCPEACKGLCLLEFYTTRDDVKFPDFVQALKEVTGDPAYSMYNLSRRSEAVPFNAKEDGMRD